MDWLGYLAATLFALVGLSFVGLVAVGLPGTWMLIGLAFVAQLLDPIPFTSSPGLHFGWAILGASVALGVVGEIVEAFAGAAGTRLGGGTRHGMVGAFIGGIAGAILFTLLLPIPIVGTIVGGLVGSFAGAWIGETRAELERHPNEKLRAALGAAAGKLAGTFGKLAVGVVIWLLLVYGAFTT